MRNKINLVLLVFVCYATAAQAQEPQWELFAEGLSGPIAVDPTNSDVIYISSGTSGMWKTTDGGQTWNLYSEGWGMGSPKDILIDPANSEEILVGGGPFVGVLKSTDGGQTWIRADNGLRFDHHGFRVHQLAFDRQKGIYYLADEGGGAFCAVYRSTDGMNWEETSTRFCPLSVVVDESNGDVYAGANGAGVWKSSDAGSTWVYISRGLNVNPQNIYDLVKLKESETLYAATVRGIYKTVDGGENWFSVNDSLTEDLVFSGGIVVAEKDTNTVYAGATVTLDPSKPGGIYLSRNGGNSWVLHNIGLPDSVIDFDVTEIFLDNQANVLYASIFSVFTGARSEGHVYRLRDAVITGVSERPNQVPQVPLALKSYPNPFNSETTLICLVPRSGRVTLQIFNILGKEVVTLLDESVSPGEYLLQWDGTDNAGRRLPSGIYLFRMELGGEAHTIKLLMLN